MNAEQPSDFQRFIRSRGLIPALSSDRDDELSKGLAKDLWAIVHRWVQPPQRGVPQRHGQLSNLLAPIYRQLRMESRTEKSLAQKISAEPSILLYVIDQLVLAVVAELQRTAMLNERVRDQRRSAVLGFYDGGVRRMNKILDEGGSSWRIDWPHGGLVRRVSADLQAVYERATADESSSVKYLSDAWNDAMSFNGSASDSYSSAIKALEAEFGPIVVPDADYPSLGMIISTLRSKPQKWDARLTSRHWKARNSKPSDRVLVIAGVLNLLWEARIQHANPDQYEKNDQQDALDAVALASALIEIQRRGFIRQIDIKEP